MTPEAVLFFTCRRLAAGHGGNGMGAVAGGADRRRPFLADECGVDGDFLSARPYDIACR